MKRIYSVRDLKAAAYGPLMSFAADAVAVRSFVDLLQAEGTMPQRHPEDFELVELGAFYDEDAERDAMKDRPELVVIGIRPRVIMTGSSWLAMQATGPALAKEG